MSSLSPTSCETELAEWKGSGGGEAPSQVVHSRWNSLALLSVSLFSSDYNFRQYQQTIDNMKQSRRRFVEIHNGLTSVIDLSWISPAGFPANLRQHTGDWVLRRFLSNFLFWFHFILIAHQIHRINFQERFLTSCTCGPSPRVYRCIRCLWSEEQK